MKANISNCKLIHRRKDDLPVVRFTLTICQDNGTPWIELGGNLYSRLGVSPTNFGRYRNVIFTDDFRDRLKSWFDANTKVQEMLGDDVELLPFKMVDVEGSITFED